MLKACPFPSRLLTRSMSTKSAAITRSNLPLWVEFGVFHNAFILHKMIRQMPIEFKKPGSFPTHSDPHPTLHSKLEDANAKVLGKTQNWRHISNAKSFQITKPPELEKTQNASRKQAGYYCLCVPYRSRYYYCYDQKISFLLLQPILFITIITKILVVTPFFRI